MSFIAFFYIICTVQYIQFQCICGYSPLRFMEYNETNIIQRSENARAEIEALIDRK